MTPFRWLARILRYRRLRRTRAAMREYRRACRNESIARSVLWDYIRSDRYTIVLDPAIPDMDVPCNSRNRNATLRSPDKGKGMGQFVPPA